MALMSTDLGLDSHAQLKPGSAVHANTGNSPTEYAYHGRVIHLQSAQENGRRWICEYIIVECRPTHSFRESGYPAGSFSTREKAEAAALDVAQGVIDVREPRLETIH
ncbi:MAG: hypothetical protein QM706_16740 [Nitrospira sp.]